MIERLELTAAHWEEMRAHVQACAPMEGCGLLAGKSETVLQIYPIANTAQSHNRFRMDPVEQLLAFDRMQGLELDLLGIFHSHPATENERAAVLDGPSETDVREAAYPAVHVIWSRRVGRWHGRGFWIEDHMIKEVPLMVSSPE